MGCGLQHPGGGVVVGKAFGRRWAFIWITVILSLMPRVGGGASDCLSYITTPSLGGPIINIKGTFRISGWAASHSRKIEVYLVSGSSNDTKLLTLTAGTPQFTTSFHYDLDTTKLRNLSYYSFYVVATDAEGVEHRSCPSGTVYVKQDDVAPVISQITVSPASAGNEVSGVVSFRVIASDNISRNVGVSAYMNSAFVQGQNTEIASGSTAILTFDTRQMTNGEHDMNFTASDTSGNMSPERPFRIRVYNPGADTQLPVARLIKPIDGTTVTKALFVQGSATDNMGISYQAFYLKNDKGGIETAIKTITDSSYQGGKVGAYLAGSRPARHRLDNFNLSN